MPISTASLITQPMSPQQWCMVQDRMLKEQRAIEEEKERRQRQEKIDKQYKLLLEEEL